MSPSTCIRSSYQLTHLLIFIVWASPFVSADPGTTSTLGGGSLRLGGKRHCLRRRLSLFGNMPATSASEDDGATNSQSPVVPRRRLTLSGGGVPEINAAVSSDETEVLETKALQLARGGAEAAATEGVLLHRQHMISSLVAGIGSGFLASVVCAPLDLIRTRMQVMGDVRAHGAPTSTRASSMPSLSVYRALADIVKQDGIRGCFRGLGATLATVPAFWGLYFPLYEHLKKDFHHRYDRFRDLNDAPGTGPCPPLVHMGAAMAAGAAADIVCNPLFLVRTRIQTEALHYFERPPSERVPLGVLKTVKAVYAEGGIPAFWRGLTASLLGLGHVAIQFPVYEVRYVPERGGLIAFTPFIDTTFLLLTPTFLLRHHLQSPF
mmetsp:Transcript_1854/g.5420  ORF Transcript_1854/g.5420 Transcript_1854/m.5420 type:complete len:378 (+) Transcript_1854:64-1197(+)